MKNHPVRHEIGVIQIPFFPTGCKYVGILVFILTALGTFNYWWLMLSENDYYQLLNGIYNSAIEPKAAAKTTHCNSRSIGTESCDVFSGKWVPDPSPPLYTNDTCPYIFANQDCMTNGRPDRGFLQWRWQPHDCDIPAFDPALFLRLMTGKGMLFVGDSLARNQMQSLLCLLAQVETPAHYEGMEPVWSFPSYNFTLALAWAPFLVSYNVENSTWRIHVDRPDEAWKSQLADYDVAVFSTLNWFFRRSIYYAQGQSFSQFDPDNVASRIQDMLESMRHVWSNVWKHLVDNYKGIAILRTESVSHFDDNPWNKGGACYKTQPRFDPYRNMSLPWVDKEVLKIQMAEFEIAKQRMESSNSSCQLRLLDVTYNTLLRPDGHPNTYRVQYPAEPRNDCTHWCMPGPVDSWNQLLFVDPQIMCS